MSSRATFRRLFITRWRRRPATSSNSSTSPTSLFCRMCSRTSIGLKSNSIYPTPNTTNSQIKPSRTDSCPMPTRPYPSTKPSIKTSCNPHPANTYSKFTKKTWVISMVVKPSYHKSSHLIYRLSPQNYQKLPRISKGRVKCSNIIKKVGRKESPRKDKLLIQKCALLIFIRLWGDKPAFNKWLRDSIVGNNPMEV